MRWLRGTIIRNRSPLESNVDAIVAANERANLDRRQCKKLPMSRDKIARGLRRKMEGKGTK
jgi:hypothetical protein